MEKRKTEAYRFYKSRYPGAIILFHLSGKYVALLDDASTLGGTGGEFSIPASDVGKLSDITEGNEVHIVTWRNKDGELDFPDVAIIMEDEHQDY